ncbi:unnamed protein product [Hymenolepis diminuta]|uniref:CHCH domain-containing protein n=1 Tax=Hymenolepis diminuta TaxID=6216 RepID=A0A0R3S8S8_HYMDI|nr:unnamed protein product [Hymenolepis diminuta]VUZ39005.1 unnamed protein product [Hymenolepis diminuta]
MGRRGSPSPSRRPAMPSRQMATRPVVAPPPPTVQQPSMLKQVAATAAGVAVGSAVGHAVGNALTSGGSGSNAVPEPAFAQQPAVSPPAQDQTQNWNPCQYQIDQLVSCSQLNSDITQCQSIANALRDCRRMYNLQ